MLVDDDVSVSSDGASSSHGGAAAAAAASSSAKAFVHNRSVLPRRVLRFHDQLHFWTSSQFDDDELLELRDLSKPLVPYYLACVLSFRVGRRVHKQQLGPLVKAAPTGSKGEEHSFEFVVSSAHIEVDAAHFGHQSSIEATITWKPVFEAWTIDMPDTSEHVLQGFKAHEEAVTLLPSQRPHALRLHAQQAAVKSPCPGQAGWPLLRSALGTEQTLHLEVLNELGQPLAWEACRHDLRSVDCTIDNKTTRMPGVERLRTLHVARKLTARGRAQGTDDGWLCPLRVCACVFVASVRL
jgi:hypothetical protein